MFLKWLTLKELCTRVSSKSITTHFLFMSWCRTGANKNFCGDCKEQKNINIRSVIHPDLFDVIDLLISLMKSILPYLLPAAY